jgi:magnesium transporter
MLRVFQSKAACLAETDWRSGPLPADTSWADLCDPTPEEAKAVEEAFKIVLPTREEMQEIEASSRLYVEDNATFMIATIVSGTETDAPESNAVAFILIGGHLITVRHSSPKSFESFPLRAAKQPGLWESGERILVGLLEAIVDRTADILERVSFDLDTLSRQIFTARSRHAPLDGGDFQSTLFQLGRKNDLVARVRESLVSFNRMVTFLTPATDVLASKDLKGHVKILSRDINSLSDHATYLSNKIQFQLDATLGLISIEQNKIIKVLAIAGTVLGPPALLTSLWGMNFHFMPELNWKFGYIFALLLIVLSGALPLAYLKWRHWF